MDITIQSAFLISMLLFILGLIVISFVAVNYKNKASGLESFVIFFFLSIIGFLGMYFRDSLPSLFGVFGSNFISFLGMMFLLHGIIRFYNRKTPYVFLYSLLFFFILFFLYFTYIDLNLYVRIAGFSSFTSFVFMSILYIIYMINKGKRKRFDLFTAACILLVLVNIIRVVTTFFYETPDSYTDYTPDSINIILGGVFGLLLSTGILSLVSNKAINEAEENSDILKNIIISMPSPAMLHSENGEILILSKVWTELTGYTIEDIPTIDDWFKNAYDENIGVAEGVRDVIYQVKNKIYDNIQPINIKNGSKKLWSFRSSYIGVDSDNNKLAMTIASDITKIKEYEESLIKIGYEDSLTKLGNRRYFEDNLKVFDIPDNYPLTIVMADINGLKLINDAFGHSSGDEVLIKAANIIKKASRKEYLISRVGGDEFVIIMPNMDEKSAEEFIDSVNKDARQTIIESIPLSISFGYKTKHEASEDINDIYRSAEDSMYREKLLEIPSMRSSAIETILSTLYEKDKNSEIHSRTVSDLSERIAVAFGMSRQDVAEVKTAGLLHDIGKIIIPINIINKVGKLTIEEYKSIKTHPEIGFRILNSTSDMRSISNIVLNHHERWDGKGYPRGIKSDKIPLKSRIISIADAFDAMTSERTYRDIISKEEALKEILNNSGTQFDPKLVKVFELYFEDIIV